MCEECDCLRNAEYLMEIGPFCCTAICSCCNRHQTCQVLFCTPTEPAPPPSPSLHFLTLSLSRITLCFSSLFVPFNIVFVPTSFETEHPIVMTDYLPNSDGLTRSTLRDTIKRIRRIRMKAGAKDEDAEDNGTGDPFQDLANAFIRAVTRTKNTINERNEGCRQHGQDRMAIEQSVEIRRDIRQMEAMLLEMQTHVDKAELLLIKENRKKKPKAKKVELFTRNFEERRGQVADCAATLDVVKEMDSERVEYGKKEVNATKEMQLGKKANLRAQLFDMRRKREGGNGDAGGGEGFVDDTVGGGRLEDNEETKDQMKTLSAQDAKIDAALDRIKEGVGRLHTLAVDMGGQLDMQNEMLEATEQTVDKQTKQLRSINRRLDKLMKDTKPMKCFLYVCLVILVIALVGFFLLQFNVI